MNKIKDNEKLLLQSLCHIAVIESLIVTKYEDFIKNFNSLDSIMFHLIQIGELAGKFSDDFCSNNNDIDFRNIKGLRNIVVHDYAGVIYNEIFDIVTKDIIELKEKYKNILVNQYNIDSDTIDNYVTYYVNNRLFNF